MSTLNKSHAEIATPVRGPGRVDGDGWRLVSESRPDDDLTVLVYAARSIEPVWLGYLDGEVWCDVSGATLFGDEAPTHWMPMPEPPVIGSGVGA